MPIRPLDASRPHVRRGLLRELDGFPEPARHALAFFVALLCAEPAVAHAQQLGARCSRASDCSTGLECRNLGPGFGSALGETYCTRSCVDASDCSSSTVCMTMRDTPSGGRCTPRGSAALGAFCIDNVGCASGLCASGTCREACRSDCDCGAGMRCASLDRADTVPGACRPGPNTCTSCGDGVVGEREECDEGPRNSDSVPDRCRSNCVRAHCGDGVVDAGEACDDGNRIDRDGCSSTCRRDSAAPIDGACLPFESSCSGDLLGRRVCEGSIGYLECRSPSARDAGAGTLAQQCVCSRRGWQCSSTPECRLLSTDDRLERPVERPVGCSIGRGARAPGVVVLALVLAAGRARRARRLSRRSSVGGR